MHQEEVYLLEFTRADDVEQMLNSEPMIVYFSSALKFHPFDVRAESIVEVLNLFERKVVSVS